VKAKFEVPKPLDVPESARGGISTGTCASSSPGTNLATNAVVHFGRHYIPRGGVVYDIGASDRETSAWP